VEGEREREKKIWQGLCKVLCVAEGFLHDDSIVDYIIIFDGCANQ
jgi:hypothetical protein